MAESNMAKSKTKIATTPQERVEQLGRRLSDAICGWLTFQQAARRHRAYNEHLTYLPTFEVADGRKWKVFPQFGFQDPLTETRKSVDFLFFHEVYSVFALLEIKFQKYRGAQVAPFSPDAEKMMRVTHAMIAEQVPSLATACKASLPIYRLMMSIGQGSRLRSLWKLERESLQLRNQASRVFAKSKEDDGWSQTNHSDGCLRISPAIVGRDFRVLTLYERNWAGCPTLQRRRRK